MSQAPLELIDWDIDAETGAVTRLRTAGGDFEIASWGAEFGDWLGTFGQHRRGGLNCEVLDWRIDRSSRRELVTRVELRLPTGRFRFTGEDTLEERELIRSYRLEAVDGPISVGDFVVRGAYLASQWPRGEIAGRSLLHMNANRLEQHPTRRAVLESDTLRLTSEILDTRTPRGMSVTSYLRDEPDGRWILHHRLITEEDGSDEYVLRVRYSAWSSRDKPIVANRLLRRLLWRWSERHWGIRLPTIQVCGNVRLVPGDECSITSCVKVFRTCAT